MKKILILTSIITLSGCGYAPMDNFHYIIIEGIEQSNENYCRYYGKGRSGIIFTPCSPSFMFRDTCNKFNVGDTINFIKYEKKK